LSRYRASIYGIGAVDVIGGAPGAVRGQIIGKVAVLAIPIQRGAMKTLRPTMREVLSSPKSAQVPGCAQAFHTICERITR
jgi:hypothetical protein